MAEEETASEVAFREYCVARGFAIHRIPDANSGRFPDFEVETPCGKLIAEIKELTANEDDKELEKSLAETGRGSQVRRPGRRVTKAIRAAKGQLKAYQDRECPRMIVLFDNRLIHGRRRDIYGEPLNEMDVDAGMFGEIPIRFAFEENGEAAQGNPSVHAGNRALTKDRGRYVSAVAVLFSPFREQPIHLDIYHNPYALHPLYPGYLPDKADTHLLKKANGWSVLPGWDEFVGERDCGPQEVEF